MGNHKRKRSRRQVRCTLCTPHRWHGNGSERFAANEVQPESEERVPLRFRARASGRRKAPRPYAVESRLAPDSGFRSVGMTDWTRMGTYRTERDRDQALDGFRRKYNFMEFRKAETA